MSHIHDALVRASQSREQQPPNSPLEMNFIISALLKRKKLFLYVFFGFLVVACSIILLLPKKYEAEMKLLVKNERQDLVISPDSNANAVHPNEPTEYDINSEIELLRSRDVLRKVAFGAGLSILESGTVQAAGEVSPVSLDKALDRLDRVLKISAIKKSNIIDVTYTSKDPELASLVLRKLQDAYLENHLKSHGTPGSFVFFDQQAKIFKQRLQTSEDQLKAFQEKYSSLVQPDQDQALTSHSMDSQASLELIDAQIADYEQRISQEQNALASLDARVVTQVRTIPQAQLIGNLNQTLIDLRNKQTDAVAKFRPDDRRILELNQQIADTTAALHDALEQISTEKQTDTNPVRQDAEKDFVSNQIALSGLRARRDAVARVVGGYQDRMFHLAGATIQHDQLLNLVKEDQDNYLLYEKKREEARIAEALDRERITNVAIVQAPVTPVRPSSPKVPLDILLSVICAAFLACTVVTAVESLSVKPLPQPQEHRLLRAAVAP